MLRISTVLVALAMAGIGAVADAETVYKWVDGAGQVHYTDLPPRQADARILGVYQQESGEIDQDDTGYDYADEGDEAGSAPQGSAEAPRTPEPPVSAQAMAEVEADAAKAKVEQCKAARDRYQRYIDSRRLFREKPDGTREYLTDKELTEARARAKLAVDDYCN